MKYNTYTWHSASDILAQVDQVDYHANSLSKEQWETFMQDSLAVARRGTPAEANCVYNEVDRMAALVSGNLAKHAGDEEYDGDGEVWLLKQLLKLLNRINKACPMP